MSVYLIVLCLEFFMEYRNWGYSPVQFPWQLTRRLAIPTWWCSNCPR